MSRDHRTHVLKNMKIHEVSLVESPMNPLATVVLMKGRHGTAISVDSVMIRKADSFPSGDVGSEVGTQDNRTEDQKAAQLAAVCRQALAKPPLPTEDRARWLVRVFGRAYADQLYSDQLYILRQLFGHLRNHLAVRKSASEALDTIAASIRAAEPALSQFQAFSKACRTPEGAALYGHLRNRLLPEATPDEIAKADAEANTDASDANNQSDASDGAAVDASDNDDGETDAEFLDRRAKEIGAGTPGLSPQQSYLRACLQHPDRYASMCRWGHN